jgi:hypothetical protein
VFTRNKKKPNQKLGVAKKKQNKKGKRSEVVARPIPFYLVKGGHAVISSL